MKSPLKQLTWAVVAALGFAASAAQADIKIMYKTAQHSLDGNATADLVWKATNSSQQALWLMNGNYSSDATALNPPTPEMTGALVVLTGDFGGDGKADLLWRTPAGGYWLTEMNGLQIASTHGILADTSNPGGDWVVVQKGDFNGDGKTDLLWKRTSDGAYAVWLMNGSSVAPTDYAFVDAPAAGFNIVALGDFNGDNKTDILWQNAAGDVYVQLVTGVTNNVLNSTVTAEPSMAGYQVVGIGDFGGDHRADIVWINGANDSVMWQMNGAAIQSNSTILAGGTTWVIDFIRDLDNDGKSDLIWRSTADGNTGIWIMNGASATAYGHLIDANTDWSLKYMVDLNGDGKCDGIYVNNTDGSVATWLIAGGQAYAYAVVSGPNSGWAVNYLP